MVDRFLALILLPFVGAFILALSVLIIVVDRFLPFFVTKRVGKSGRIFVSYKLQTMTPPTPDTKFDDPADDRKRLTWFGRICRDHGWDELPQIANILLGDMAFVGPRPLSEKVYATFLKSNQSRSGLISQWKAERLRFLPGLSGWHQVHLVDHNIIKYDLEYLKEPTIARMIEVVIKSILILVMGKKRFFGGEIAEETYQFEL